MKRKVVKLVGLFTFFHLFTLNASGEASVFKNKTSETSKILSPGISHTKESYRSDSIYESVNLLHINLNDPYTKMELGVPNPINSLKTTTVLARDQSYDGHRIVGATNASFFHSNGYPANLLAVDNEIKNYGVLGEKFESPTQKPVAFGINNSGQAIADYFTSKLSFSANGKTILLDRVNGQRQENKSVLFTSTRQRTGTNEWGVEVIVEKASKNTKTLYFGDKITGTVAHVTKIGEKGNSKVPADGFVISAHNKQAATELSKLKKGDPVSLTISIDKKWQDAQFIIAAGPLLVKDKKVHISMPTKSSFASARHPRTAVGVDATGKKVILVTVDGRRPGHSNGTSLQDLANLLISKGAVAAINLDGGGSTTMSISQPGSLTPQIVNRPADGAERRVSAILQAVSVAPPGKAKSISLNASSINLIKGTTFQLDVKNAMDIYLNPLKLSTQNINWKVEGNIGEIKDNTFKATASGAGKIIATSGEARAEMKVKVIDPKNEPIILHSFGRTTDWKAATARAKATVANSSTSETKQIGKASVKLSYDFTTAETGTKAAYVTAKKPISIIGSPHHIGVWVYGDGGKHWLRANIIDGARKRHTINFTTQTGVTWNGWKYVTATVPNNLSLPLEFERIYLTQPNNALQNKGKVFFSNLQAVYSKNYRGSIYVDVVKNHWAYNSIENLNKSGLIKGYPNGTFQAEATITRAEAASLIARSLQLKTTKSHGFKDVNKNHFAYKDIAAVAEKGIVVGRAKGKFDPNGQLTRAEMASILNRAFYLSGNTQLEFIDVDPSHWAYKDIKVLVANELTSGFPDNTFKPNRPLTRAEFAAFLDRLQRSL